MAVSCDSFDEATNIKIGRGNGKHVYKLAELSNLCLKHNIKFKINTVVNRYNYTEDMNQAISQLAPFRWKCFQVLVVRGENHSGETLRVCISSQRLIHKLHLVYLTNRLFVGCQSIHHNGRRIRPLLRPPCPPSLLYSRIQRGNEELLRTCSRPP